MYLVTDLSPIMLDWPQQRQILQKRALNPTPLVTQQCFALLPQVNFSDKRAVLNSLLKTLFYKSLISNFPECCQTILACSLFFLLQTEFEFLPNSEKCGFKKALAPKWQCSSFRLTHIGSKNAIFYQK